MLNMMDEERGRRRRETTLSTSIGRILHTQQEVRSLLKNMTSAPSHHHQGSASTSSHAGRHHHTAAAEAAAEASSKGGERRPSASGKNYAKTQWAGAAAAGPSSLPEQAEVLDNLNVEHCIRHPGITLGCAICREQTQSTACGYLYNHTLLKPWLPLCPLCYVSMRETLASH